MERESMTKDQPEKVERISADELDFQRSIMQEQERLSIALDVWGRHMMSKYKLTQNDGIAPDGTIVRNAANQDSASSQTSSP
jgi:hypothetical protein